MKEKRDLLLQLFRSRNVELTAEKEVLLQKFLQDKEVGIAVDCMIEKQDRLMAKWKKAERIAEIVQQPVRILNGTVGKPYEATLNFETLAWQDLSDYDFAGLEELGLQFDKEQRKLTGVPTQSGDKTLLFRFRVNGEEDAPYAEKEIPFLVNPDPKSLWKNLESNRDDPYWKEDNVTQFAPLGDRHILVSSKRGRSHANVGSFREDDFAFSDLGNGWSIVAVSDGAGSAKVARKGSAIACAETVAFFRDEQAMAGLAELDDLVPQVTSNGDEEAKQKINKLVYTNLGKAVYGVHKKLHEFARENSLTMKDLSATLVFVLFKKYNEGYAFLSFGVGDCPMAVLNKDASEVTLLNWIDVGEFSGGTRFITMPEIFQNEKFATRFAFNYRPDFSYLVLMSDGIYDPKFSVEANLPKSSAWQAFFADIRGENEGGAGVDLKVDNTEIEQQFSAWMDFWSPGNHDDRTLAIVF